MTGDAFRADLLASAASRAETVGCGIREAFVDEMLERLSAAGELPDAESCAEQVLGMFRRRIEIDAYAFDDADESLHLFIAVLDGGADMPPALTLPQARDQGFQRLQALYEHARGGWLTKNVEESRPLWQLARRIEQGGRLAALRLHVLSDRPISERIREIPSETTSDGVSVTFQIWDLLRLKRIHDGRSARDDLVVDFSGLPGGGLRCLRAAADGSGYDGYLAAVPAEVLADVFLAHGSRLLEGNVRTFLGRRGNVNKGIAATLEKMPGRFFAYNNGIAATASAVTFSADGLLTTATDLQIVNGAQTTASLASARREGKVDLSRVFVPMKLSVVEPTLASEMIPLISRYANSQNAVRPSDFFANHPFHRRVEEISRRLLAPAVGGSQVQTHWYYERARGQHLNDQAGLTAAKKQQFLRLNPRSQVITKTDLAKVENCFALLPDVTCKGAEKSFVELAERVTREWQDNARRAAYGDDWFRAAVARTILFRTAERVVSGAPWYEGGYRAQIVAYALAKLADLATKRSGGGGLDYERIWRAQAAGPVLEQQLRLVAQTMANVLRNPPQAGQNISEWAKQQACRHAARDAAVEVAEGFDGWLIDKATATDLHREGRRQGRDDAEIEAVTRVVELGPDFWAHVERFAIRKRLVSPEEVKLLSLAMRLPAVMPTGRQAKRIVAVLKRCEQNGLPPQDRPT